MHSHEAADAVVQRGFAARVTRDNKVHQFSSRSHAVVQLTLREGSQNGAVGVLVGKMSLVRRMPPAQHSDHMLHRLILQALSARPTHRRATDRPNWKELRSISLCWL